MEKKYKEDIINEAVEEINHPYWDNNTPIGRDAWVRAFAEKLVKAAKKEEFEHCKQMIEGGMKLEELA